jgi:hypothetical protein
MSQKRRERAPIDADQAKSLIDQEILLDGLTETTVKASIPNDKVDELSNFIGGRHNAYVFSKSEILKLFGIEDEGGETANEHLLIVKGAHTTAVSDAEHSPGSPTVVLMSVREEADLFVPLNHAPSIVEFPWLQNVSAEINDKELVIRKSLGQS